MKRKNYQLFHRHTNTNMIRVQVHRFPADGVMARARRMP